LSGMLAVGLVEAAHVAAAVNLVASARPSQYIRPTMTNADRIRLLFGPYTMPRFRLGQTVMDEARDRDVVICGITDARIPWPMGLPKGSRARSLVVFDGLADAVRRESNQAICHWWGITGQTVSIWRKALGVGPVTAGTLAVRREQLVGKTRSAATRRKLRAARRARGARPVWTKAEDKLLRTLPVAEVVRRTGRTRQAVYMRRFDLGITGGLWDK